MSYNDNVSVKESLDLKILTKTIEALKLDSEEEKRFLVDYESYSDGLEKEIEALNTSNQLEVSFFQDQKRLTDIYVLKYLFLEEHYIKLFNNYIAEFDSKRKVIKGKKAELMQKLGLLKSKDRFYRFAFREEFENLYNINTSRLTYEELNIDTEAKVATLPVEEEREVSVDKIFISRYSNCIAGNYETGNNKFIYSIVDKDETSVFEAFKRGDGPLKLGMTLSFRREEVVNKIILKEVGENLLSSIDIEDIRFNISNSKSISIKNLVDKRLQSFSLRSEGEIHIVHLPVKCKSISIKLKAYKENTNNIEKYFSIALRSVTFLNQKFKSKGEVQSSKLNLPAGYISVNLEEESFPKITKGFSLNKNVSVDGGLTFEPNDNVLLLDGQEKEVIYSYTYSKSNTELAKGVNLKSEDYFVDVESKSSYISKKSSPNSLSLPFDNFINDSFKVVQNKVLSRSTNREKSTKLGDLRNSGKNYFSIPTNLNYFEFDDLIVRVGGELYSKVESEDLVNQDGVYYLKNYNQIVIYSERANPFLKVTMSLPPKKPRVIERPEGYYLEIDENFDFDKNEIKITTYIEDSGLKTKIFNGSAETRIFLEDEYIDSLSFKVLKHEVESESWIEVEEAEYSIDLEKGILTIDESLLTEKLTVKYRNHVIKTLSKDEYEIWVREDKVKGIYVYPENLSYTEIEETLAGGTSGWERVEKFDFEDRLVPESNRAVNSSGTRFLLSNKNIIIGSLSFKEGFQEFKEVAFKDGLSEHLNIKKMEQDFVPRIQKNNVNEIKFSLQYIPTTSLYSEPITLYKNGVEVSSERYVIEDRIVTLELLEDEEISEGYYFSYSFLSEEKVDKTYSIDYKNGVLYTSEVVSRPEAAKIEYKISSVKAEYYIYNPIENFEIDLVNSNLNIYTEEFLNINNSIKMFCFKNKSNFNFEGLEAYLSPIIYSLKVGFN